MRGVQRQQSVLILESLPVDSARTLNRAVLDSTRQDDGAVWTPIAAHHTSANSGSCTCSCALTQAIILFLHHTGVLDLGLRSVNSSFMRAADHLYPWGEPHPLIDDVLDEGLHVICGRRARGGGGLITARKPLP
jgi:hypothetical protein